MWHEDYIVQEWVGYFSFGCSHWRVGFVPPSPLPFFFSHLVLSLFCSVIGIEHGTSCSLGECSTTDQSFTKLPKQVLNSLVVQTGLLNHQLWWMFVIMFWNSRYQDIFVSWTGVKHWGCWFRSWQVLSGAHTEGDFLVSQELWRLRKSLLLVITVPETSLMINRTSYLTHIPHQPQDPNHNESKFFPKSPGSPEWEGVSHYHTRMVNSVENTETLKKCSISLVL